MWPVNPDHWMIFKADDGLVEFSWILIMSLQLGLIIPNMKFESVSVLTRPTATSMTHNVIPTIRLAHIKLSSSEYHHQQHGFGELSMGNEMGNNNSSGLQEENTNTGGDKGRSLQDAGHGDAAQVENHIVPVGEGIDYQENETRLDSDAPESQIVNQIFDGKEKEETEVHDHSAGSTKVEVKSNDEVGDGTNEIQPTTSSSEDSNEKPLLSSLEENLSQLNDLKLEKQTSIKKDDEEMNNNTIFDTKSWSNDLEPQESVDSKSDQPDQLAEIQADPSVQDSNESRLEIEDILGSNLTCISEENGHLIDDNISKDIGDSSVSVSGVTQEVEIKRDDLSVKEMASKGNEIGNDLSQKSVMTSELQSGVEIKCNGDLPTETNAIRSDSSEAELEAVSTDKSLNSHLQVSETIDNSVAFTAATILVGKESEHGEDKPDPCPAQSYEESVKGSEIDNACVSQPELVMIESECENSNRRATDYTCSDSGNNRDCVEEANVSQSELVMIEPKPVNNEKGATDYASSDPGINEHNIEEANLSQSELVMIEPELVNSEKGATDYASSDPGINKDSIEEANVSRSELVMIEPELVNREKGVTDYASSDPGINKDGIEEANGSQSELVMIETETGNYGTRATDYTFCDSGIKNCIEEARVAENGHLIDEVSTEQHKGSIEEAVMVPESGVVLTESSLDDCKTEEALKEKKIVEEIERNEASYGIENNTEVSESGNQCMPPTLPVEQTEAFLPESALLLIQPQDNQQTIERESEKIKSSNESISELKQENCAELTNEKPGEDVSEYTTNPALTVAECNPPANNFSGQCATDSYQARESVGRDSTESNPNNSSIQAQMQKSPSFGLDLRIEARSEESDRTPLLYQDKTAIEDFSTQAYISLGNSIEHTHNGQDKDMLDTQAMPVEEKVVRMERSDSEKLKTPFLGFLKEEEEVHILITPQKQDNKGNKEQVTLTSPKSKEKRRPRSSLFTNCMCCTTVIN
ncbi:hypothetical protein QYF36_001994 [Acer negundo]|nr:hypothetical protein QYF36_001994 [Acer negundo]